MYPFLRFWRSGRKQTHKAPIYTCISSPTNKLTTIFAVYLLLRRICNRPTVYIKVCERRPTLDIAYLNVPHLRSSQVRHALSKNLAALPAH